MMTPQPANTSPAALPVADHIVSPTFEERSAIRIRAIERIRVDLMAFGLSEDQIDELKDESRSCVMQPGEFSKFIRPMAEIQSQS